MSQREAIHVPPTTVSANEIALAKMLAAWSEWISEPGNELVSTTLTQVGQQLKARGWLTYDDSLSPTADRLIARARKAGAL